VHRIQDGGGQPRGPLYADEPQPGICSEEVKKFRQQAPMNQVKVLVEVDLVLRRRRLHATLVSLGHRSRPKHRDLFRRVPRRNLERVDVANAGSVLCLIVDYRNEREGMRVRYCSGILCTGLFSKSGPATSRWRLAKIDDLVQLVR